jgi:hypothetical protein
MENKYTRREVLGLVGAGAAVLGASSLANSATKNEATPEQKEEHESNRVRPPFLTDSITLESSINPTF